MSESCQHCGCPPDKMPMVFRGTGWCCEDHRKLLGALRVLYDCETCGYSTYNEEQAQEHRDDNGTHAVFEKEMT